jgi:hypothetical protein
MASPTAVKTAASATVEAASTSTTMIELRMMAVTAPMIFPRMMDVEAGTVATPPI